MALVIVTYKPSTCHGLYIFLRVLWTLSYSHHCHNKVTDKNIKQNSLDEFVKFVQLMFNFFFKSASGHVYKYLVFMFVCLFLTATPCSVAAHSNNISN